MSPLRAGGLLAVEVGGEGGPGWVDGVGGAGGCGHGAAAQAVGQRPVPGGWAGVISAMPLAALSPQHASPHLHAWQ